METQSNQVSSELLFLKYKGIPSPWELSLQAKRYGFKCKKYANWPDVHVAENSRQILKQMGDSLIDSAEVLIGDYGELSRIWERVQRWTKDKETFSLEPDINQEFEKMSRIIDVGSQKPQVVDLIIVENGYDYLSISVDDRWLLFLAICINDFIRSTKRYAIIVTAVDDKGAGSTLWKDFVRNVSDLVTQLYSQVGFDVSSNEARSIILLFTREIGCSDVPAKTDRGSEETIKILPKVWVQRFEGGPSDLVRFQYLDDSISVKINSHNKIFSSNAPLGRLLSDDQFWTIIGISLLSHINHIDEIQDFFDTFAKQLRLHR